MATIASRHYGLSDCRARAGVRWCAPRCPTKHYRAHWIGSIVSSRPIVPTSYGYRTSPTSRPGSATGTGLRGRSACQLVSEPDSDTDALRGTAACVSGCQPICGQRSRNSSSATAQIAEAKVLRPPKPRAIIGSMWLNFLSAYCGTVYQLKTGEAVGSSH